MESPKTVAIIGAGESGLVSAKYMLENGLEPTIFEKSTCVCGLWNSNCSSSPSSSWKSLKTNISRYTTCFSDFAWPANISSIFPTQNEMKIYLEEYCAHFIPIQYLQLDSIVTSIQKNSSSSSSNSDLTAWTVKYNSKGHKYIKSFDFVIIATGFFSKPYIPSSISMSNKPGTGTVDQANANGMMIIHSGDYISPEQFKGKSVIVVGASFSSAEISSEISTQAKSVINVASKPFWAIPRFIPLEPENPATPFFPLDLVFYKRPADHKSIKELIFKTELDYERSNKYFNQLYGPESNNNGNFKRPSADLPEFVAVTDNYLSGLRSGRISVEYGRVQSIKDKTVILDNEKQFKNIDAIIFCTGYHPDLSYLDQGILQTINFDPNDTLNPLLLYKSMLHPKLQNLAFIGMYRGPYFATIELQAMLAAKLFSGNISQISDEIQYDGINIEKQIKDRMPRSQFPHGDYKGLVYSFAELLGIVPSDDWANKYPIVTPFDFNPKNTFAKEMLCSLEIECELFKLGKMVAGAVFRFLEGTWAFQRTVNDIIGNETIYLDGTRTFTLFTHSTSSSAIAAVAEPDQQQYHDTEFIITNGFGKDACKYTWRYNQIEDILSVSFLDQCTQVTVTNNLKFLPPTTNTSSSSSQANTNNVQFPSELENLPGWKAHTEYNFQGNFVNSYYVFQFNGMNLNRFDVISNVIGPMQNSKVSTVYFPSKLTQHATRNVFRNGATIIN